MMLQKEELQNISEAIRRAESRTSGEIRVCIAKRCKGDPMEAASRKFRQLKMDATQLRNGVLIYVSPADRKAAILGDIGINESVQSNFWEEALEEMLSSFRKGLISEGICRGIDKVGELIKVQYPARENDINELNDEVTMEE